MSSEQKNAPIPHHFTNIPMSSSLALAGWSNSLQAKTGGNGIYPVQYTYLI
jgi:hypothetical protein